VTMATVTMVNVFRIAEKSVKEGAGEDPVEKFDGTNGSSGEREDGHHVCDLQHPCDLADTPRQRVKTAKIVTENSHKMPIQDPTPDELDSPLIIQEEITILY
jgi:hypothetical protein